jgi:hypothetical protein
MSEPIPETVLSGENAPPKRIALLACEVFAGEIAMVEAEAGARIVRRGMFEIGLHDRPDILRATLQEAVDTMDACEGIDAVVLAYGLCGLGTAGLRAGSHPLVIPRAHDCITVFLGSKERYARRQAECPGCYYYTPGWNRARRVPGPEREAALRADFAARFDPEDVDFLMENEKAVWASYHTSTYIRGGTTEDEIESEYTRCCASALGWKFEEIAGDTRLLHDLLRGPWDDARFQIVPPGQVLGHSPDDAIMKSSAPK